MHNDGTWQASDGTWRKAFPGGHKGHSGEDGIYITLKYLLLVKIKTKTGHLFVRGEGLEYLSDYISFWEGRETHDWLFVNQIDLGVVQ